MGLFVEILEVYGYPTELRINSYGQYMLYPSGTKRKVKKLTLSGYKILEQKAEINCRVDMFISDYIFYNTWKTIKK